VTDNYLIFTYSFILNLFKDASGLHAYSVDDYDNHNSRNHNLQVLWSKKFRKFTLEIGFILKIIIKMQLSLNAIYL
jgi:hypothetical protein